MLHDPIDRPARAAAPLAFPAALAVLLAVTLSAGLRVAAHVPVDQLRSVAALPPHIAGVFREPAGFRQTQSGQFLVFDRRGHTVYGVDAQRTAATKIVQVGLEAGRIIQPVAFAAAPDGTFVVADAPAGRERVQIFSIEGTRLRGFVLPGRAEVRVRLGGYVLNGVGSLQFDGNSLYVNQPGTGALITEYDFDGVARRSIGTLRPTGHEADRDLHLAFNTGLPLIDPRGGFFFVFQAGEPRFRKYDAAGTLVFERVMQGREIDAAVASQPSRWPTRGANGEVPAVPPVVRTAAVDPDGRLWVTFTVPFTYVFDREGEKVRVVQFTGAGPLAPTSLSFAPDGRLLATPGCYVFEP